MLENSLKRRLASGEVAVSMVVRLVESIEIAYIAKMAGYDSFYIDLEHCSMSPRTVGQLCIAGISAGIAPLVRTGNLSGDNIAHLLDIGAMGVIAPHIRSADDAAALVKAIRFPPDGDRGVSAGLPHFLHRPVPVRESRRVLNDATAAVVMIESIEAMERVEAIAGVEGVDLMLVGTNDLCAELGIGGEFDHPLVEEAYQRIIAAGKAGGTHVGVGGLAGRPDLMRKYVNMGARFISSGSDLQFLTVGTAERVKAVREWAS